MDREQALIDHIRPLALRPNQGFGIGDDCAVLPLDANNAWLFSVDALIEGTHFDLSWSTPEQLAYKSAMVNISDIAAMGGTPHSILLTLALPTAYSGEWAERFLTALSSLLRQYGIHLIGGDTVFAPQLMLSITIIGQAPIKHIKYRHHAKVGDILALTKSLGASYAGLQCLQKKWRGPADAMEACIAQHLTPQAHLAQGQWLAQQETVHTMMDISDGLAMDLPKLCQASDLGAELQLENLPVDLNMQQLAQSNGVRAQEVAYIGGEDYPLLCSIDSNAFADLAQAYQQQFNQVLSPIGTLTSPQTIALSFQGHAFQPQLTSFQHFA